MPAANKAYVDFYAKDPAALAWNIQRLDAAANRFEELFRESAPRPENILRLALPPGNHRLRVSFLNRIVAEPALLEVVAVAGQITPVVVEFKAAGTTLVRTEETRRGPTYRGRLGRATTVGSVENHLYRVQAVVQPLRPYQRKELMPYHAPKTDQ